MPERFDRGPKALQLLAVKLIKYRHPHDALVLADGLMERDARDLITGRSRPVLFRTAAHGPSPTTPTIASPEERRVIANTRLNEPSFSQQGYEALYNVVHFAKRPSEESWGKIWAQWFTPRRGTYQAMIDNGILPRSIRFHELTWRPLPDPHADLAYRLDLVRTPRNRKRPVTVYLFDVERYPEDNPLTATQHFDEPHQLSLGL